MKHQDNRARHLMPGLTAACAATLLLGGCAPLTQSGPDTQNIPVNIPFDSAGCPGAPAAIEADKGKRVVWQSVDAVTGDKINERYEIFFDPFVGRPQRSDRNGRLKSLPFDNNVPPTVGLGKVEYKYTIVGDRCKDKPLDPRLWLRR